MVIDFATSVCWYVGLLKNVTPSHPNSILPFFFYLGKEVRMADQMALHPAELREAIGILVFCFTNCV